MIAGAATDGAAATVRSGMRISLSASIALASLAAACADAPPAPAADPAALASFEQLGHRAARQVYPSLSTAQRVVLWKTHLARELDGVRLTPAQAAIVAEVQARLPELIERHDPALAARAEVAFSMDQLGAWFELPGRWELEVGGRGEVAGLVAENECDTRWCTTCLPPQPPGTHCGGEYCTASSSGCGWFGQQSCTRQCHLDDEILQ